MKIIVTGAKGQLGTDLVRLLSGEVIAVGHKELDITDSAAVHEFVKQHQPNYVINAAAYNKVDQAEDEPGVAYSVNALGPRNLAMACESVGATLVHVSTDYVFGRDETRLTPFTEMDAPAPASAYGTSKLAGEHFVQAGCSRHFVVRTCGVYGHAARDGAGKGNFVETMIKLGEKLGKLSVINNQFCTPTSSNDLADAIISLLQTSEYGLYHFTNDGRTTWYDFAQEIFTIQRMNVKVQPIPSSQYPTKAKRPAFSLLDSSRFELATGQPARHWQDALQVYLTERKQLMSETAGELASAEH